MGVWVNQGIGLFRMKARKVHPGSPIIPVYCCLRLTYHPGPYTLGVRDRDGLCLSTPDQMSRICCPFTAVE